MVIRKLRRWLKWIAQNWEFAATIVAVILLIFLVILDLFDLVDFQSSWVGAVIVTLLTFAVAQMARLRSAVEALTKQRANEDRVTEIPAVQISSSLHDLLASSSSWKFRGGSAKWQLMSVLPELGRRHDTTVSYLMQVVHPFNEEMVKKYAEYRWRSKPQPERPSLEESSADLREGVLACIYAAAWYAANSRLKPEVIFLRSFSPLRYDCGDDALVITVTDQTAPGLWAPQGSWYYRSVMDEIDQLPQVAPQLIFPKSFEYPSDLSDVRVDSLEQFFNSLRVRDDDTVCSFMPEIVNSVLLWSQVIKRIQESQ